MKYFIFAMICIQDLGSPNGISCFNYWEPDRKSYTRVGCYQRAETIGDDIKLEFRQKDVRVMEHVIWCVNEKGEIS